MTPIKQTITLKGKVRVTVDLEPGERLVAIKEDAFYRLAHPMDDVLHGHIIADAARVSWCSVGQEWVA